MKIGFCLQKLRKRFICDIQALAALDLAIQSGQRTFGQFLTKNFHPAHETARIQFDKDMKFLLNQIHAVFRIGPLGQGMFRCP